jgi:hypothetical protein
MRNARGKEALPARLVPRYAHVPIGIFDHQIDVASFIYIVEKGKGRRENEYANGSQ